MGVPDTICASSHHQLNRGHHYQLENLTRKNTSENGPRGIELYPNKWYIGDTGLRRRRIFTDNMHKNPQKAS